MCGLKFSSCEKQIFGSLIIVKINISKVFPVAIVMMMMVEQKSEKPLALRFSDTDCLPHMEFTVHRERHPNTILFLEENMTLRSALRAVNAALHPGLYRLFVVVKGHIYDDSSEEGSNVKKPRRVELFPKHRSLSIAGDPSGHRIVDWIHKRGSPIKVQLF